MEYGSIEREIQVEAPPEVVYAVISSPDHMREWWNGVESDVDAAAGATGEFAWRNRATGEEHVARVMVVDADPPRLFSFRWTQDAGETAQAGNSLLATFELVPAGGGTLLRVSETGFRERGWEAAKLEEVYNDHVSGWDFHLATLERYLSTLVSTS